MFIENLLQLMMNNYKSLSSEYYGETKKEFYEKRVFPKTLNGIRQHYQLNGEELTAKEHALFKQFQFGISENSILKKMGEPNYFYLKEIGKTIYTVMLFKETIMEQRVITQVHFIDGNFFLAGYSFTPANAKEAAELKATIIKKYTDEEFNRSADPIIITDLAGNKVIVSEDVHLRVCYITGDQLVHEQIAQLVTYQQEKMQQNTTNRIVDFHKNL